jgi:hypothetical protein
VNEYKLFVIVIPLVPGALFRLCTVKMRPITFSAKLNLRLK